MTNPPLPDPHQPPATPPRDSYPGMAPPPAPIDPTGPQDSYPSMAPRQTPVDPTGSLPNPQAGTTPPPMANYGPPAVQPNTSSSKTGLLVTVGFLVLLLAGGGGAWYFLSDNGAADPTISGGDGDPTDQGESDDPEEPDTEGYPMDNRNMHAEEWYNSDWHFTLHIDGEDKEASMIYVDRWDHADCSNALEETQDQELLAGNDCLYGVEGHYERPDAGFEVCQRVFEFETEGGATMAEAGIDFDPEDIFYAPVTCTRPLDDEVAWETRVDATGRYLTVTVGALTQEDPSDDNIMEFVRAVGYRHAEITNTTMWMD